jgi:hypothetical protein
VNGPGVTYGGAAIPKGYAWITVPTLSEFDGEMARCAIAHELGHLFGGKDHYRGSGSSIQDSRCLMKTGGNGWGWLTKGNGRDTIFGPIDLQSDLHFSYLAKVPKTYFASQR